MQASMNQINPKKLLLSKWTSTSPQKKEKHFLVTELIRDDQEIITQCVIEAVLTHTQYTIPWQDLKSPDHWKQGWQ